MYWNPLLKQWVWDNGTDWNPSIRELKEMKIRDDHRQKIENRITKEMEKEMEGVDGEGI